MEESSKKAKKAQQDEIQLEVEPLDGLSNTESLDLGESWLIAGCGSDGSSGTGSGCCGSGTGASGCK
jgi:hypothetical protein